MHRPGGLPLRQRPEVWIAAGAGTHLLVQGRWRRTFMAGHCLMFVLICCYCAVVAVVSCAVPIMASALSPQGPR